MGCIGLFHKRNSESSYFDQFLKSRSHFKIFSKGKQLENVGKWRNVGWHDIRTGTRKNSLMKTRVGIFEDDRADQFIFQQLITKTSPAIEPIFFRSIEEGIEAARKELFDVVVINIHYYGDNIGLDILQRLRRESKVPFVAIAITPLLLDGDLERILAAGFALALEKPQAFEALGKGKISIPGLC